MTLGFNWATNTNYSTGPDSGTATKVDPASALNGFIGGTVIAPQHVNFLYNQIAAQLLKAVDGVNGGTYTLAAPLIFAAGSDLRINNSLEVLATGEINVNSGADINVDSGAQIDLAGDLNLLSGGRVLGAAGSLVRIEDSEDLTINSNTENFLLTLTPHSQSFDAGTLAPTWLPLPSAAGWFQHDVGSGKQICFPLNLPPGDDIVTVTVRVNGAGAGGGHASIPVGTDRLQVSLISVDDDGVVTPLATLHDQSGNVAAYDVPHGIALTSGTLDSGILPRTVNALERYYVIVTGEKGANAVADTTVVTEVKGTCVARAYRSTTMVY